VAEEPDRIAVPLAWVEADEPVAFANQFLFQQVMENDFVLHIGQAFPPALVGTPEQQREQAKQIPFVPVRPLGRFSLTRERVVELVNLLQGVLASSNPTQGDQ